jgi:DNA (cytosine-5)-methyltransferase 1
VKYISICSGIEAASTAWHGLGWQPLAFSEIEPFPSAVLAHHYPTVPNLGDMSKFREWPEELLAECELLVGGTPCQAFSVAGLRKSLDDERGNLSLIYVQMFHHINEVRRRHGRPPAIALWENVPGVLSTKDNAFGCFISGLLGVDDTLETQDGKWPKAGFLGSETVRVGYRVLDAQYFAVAQRRRRVFLVAVPCELIASVGERACPSEILSLRESVLGNPPTRGEAWEGVARATAASLTSSGRGVERPGESRGQDDVVVSCPPTARTLTQRMHKGFDSTLDSQTPIITGSSTGVMAVRTAQTSANGHGLAQEVAHTLDQVQGQAVAFKPSHYTRGKDGKPDEVAPPLSADADKGDQDTLIMRQSIGFNWQNGGGYGNANDGLGITEEGTGPLSRSQVPARVTGQRTHALTTRAAAVEEDGTGRGTPIVPVAFSAKDSGSDATEELSPTMRAMQHVDGNANAGGQIAVAYGVDTYNQTVSDVSIPPRVGNAKDSLPAAMIPFVKATNPHSKDEAPRFEEAEVAACLNGWDERHDPPKHVVAFTQNSRDEVRQIDGEGQIAGALSAEMGMHQTNYLAFSPLQGGRSMPVTPESPTLEAGTGNKAPAVLAFANRTRDGVKVPEVMKDGVTPALTNPGNGGRADAVNVCAFAQNQLGEVRINGEVMGTVNTNQNASGRNTPMVHQAMQVRRLTPTECCRLQGFPDEHCDITFRKKPAADGPKYRALGNSMAVPCMAWLGYRIQLATGSNNK